MTRQEKQSGFTLIEIAIVMLIVAIVLGYTVALFPIQQELKQYRQAEQEMDEIIDALYRFAQIQGYLPCPANDNAASSGFECRDLDGSVDGDCETNSYSDEDGTVFYSCDIWYGFVPGKALGLSGDYSANGLLLDPWGQPYRYQISDSDDEDNNGSDDRDLGDGDGFPDLVKPGGIKTTIHTSIPNGGNVEKNFGLLSPDLVVCNADPSGGGAGANDDECDNAAQTIIGAKATTPTRPCTHKSTECAPVVILSTGKDKWGDDATNSWIQRENLDNSLTDRVFVSTTRSDVANAEYDDLVRWIAPNVLYSKMIESGQLP